MRIRQGNLLLIGLAIVAVLGAAGLIPRIAAERSNGVAAIVTDMRDVANIARESGIPVSQALGELRSKGLTGVAVGELTGQELLSGMLPVEYGSVENLARGDMPEGLWPDSAAIFLKPGSPYSKDIELFVSRKFPGSRAVPFKGGTLHVLPLSLGETLESGILPDYLLFELLRDIDIPVIYRPGATPGVPGEDVANAMALVLDSKPGIRSVVPAGFFVAGYPELEPVSRLLRERGITVAKVEFSQQIGIGFLERDLFPKILSLHSVRREEILSSGLTRDDLVERFVRASRERSVQLLYIRPSDLLSGSRLERFGDECGRISGRLEKLGIKMGWPDTLPLRRTGIVSALACALALVVLSLRTGSRMSGREEENVGLKTVLVIIVIAGVLAAVMLRVSLAARLSGALLAALAATEASFTALEGHRRPIRGVLSGVFVAVASGLAIAAFFGTPWYMLRMGSFSGVKATLLLPPLLILIHDLKKRVHPESLASVLSRPPIWGELAIIGGLVAAAGLVVFRSGNVSFVPGWEIRFRELLEQLLIARPRTKEIFVGYPALVLWFTVRRMDIWPKYREVFRIGATLAFSSVVNSFCHFHTHILFILLRVFNGLWTGLLAGAVMAAILVFLLLPAWRRWQGVIAG
ncbi:MAG: DUF5693 family protein [Thermovirgaceae bacterium]|nr:DUF5693 family protein [Thermovirgaceae bacterium]